MTFYKQWIKKIKENKLATALFFVILTLGIFLRSYHFSDWLHFEIDQTYDTLLVSPAVEHSIANLPLLGPTAGGGRSLRLGPAFYYMEYASAKVFGNNPTGHAMLVLILSLLAIPFFYFFCRRYFSKKLSLGLLALFSASLYIVLYSRFSWSPNVLPFLVLATFYSLLRSVSENGKSKEKWFLISILLASITSQIHFSSFFSIPFVFFIFLLIKRPKFKLKIWLAAVFVLFITYSPVILSDIKTGGQNLKYFSERLGWNKNKLQQVTEEPENKSVGEKLFQDARYSALEYFLILSGLDKVNRKRFQGYEAGLFCKTCHSDFPVRMLGLITFLAGLTALAINLKREKDTNKKDFLWLCGLWFTAMFLFIFLITYDGFYIYPRFFLFVSPLAIILFGFILEQINPDKNILRLLIFSAIIVITSGLNLQKIRSNFDQLKEVSQKKIPVETEDIFPDNARITLHQQKQILDYMESKFKNNGYPIYTKSIHEYDPVFWYHLNKLGVPFDNFKYDGINENDIYRQGNYFVIWGDSLKQKKDLEKYPPKFDIIEKKDFGSLYVLYLSPKPKSITSEKQDLSQKKPSEQSVQISQILTWKKLLSN